MIDDGTFERRLFAWLDGELPPAEAAEMEVYCAARPDARARVEAEKAADARIRAALLADPAAREAVERALARTRDAGPGAAPRPVPRGRLLRFPRWIASTAAAAAVVVAGMWFACVPPFQCGVVEALERAAESAATAPCTDGAGCPLTARMREAAGEVGVDLGNPARVPVPCCPNCSGTAFRIRWKGEDLTCVWSPCRSCDPSFRLQCDLGGSPGWAAKTHGKSLVAFRDASSGLLCSLVGPCPEETLTNLARDLRAALQ